MSRRPVIPALRPVCEWYSRVSDIHAVVVVEVNDLSVVVLDPLLGERAISSPIFNAAWTMARNLAILIER